MSADQLPFFKFVSAVIDSGIWAKLSPAARTLYPVLLKFSDGSFKPVFPGTKRLLELTGFKQKSSIQKARDELVKAGLISITRGTGRTNTHYIFRFDCLNTPLGGTTATPSGSREHTPAGAASEPHRSAEAPAYNQIHISINHQQEAKKHSELIQRFGEKAVELARNECKLAGLPETDYEIEKILCRNDESNAMTWSEVLECIQDRISPGSFRLIQNSFQSEEDGLIIISDQLPGFLKRILHNITRNIFFEPAEPGPVGARAIWINEEN